VSRLGVPRAPGEGHKAVDEGVNGVGWTRGWARWKALAKCYNLRPLYVVASRQGAPLPALNLPTLGRWACQGQLLDNHASSQNFKHTAGMPFQSCTMKLSCMIKIRLWLHSPPALASSSLRQTLDLGQSARRPNRAVAAHGANIFEMHMIEIVGMPFFKARIRWEAATQSVSNGVQLRILVSSTSGLVRVQGGISCQSGAHHSN